MKSKMIMGGLVAAVLMTVGLCSDVSAQGYRRGPRGGGMALSINGGMGGVSFYAGPVAPVRRYRPRYRPVYAQPVYVAPVYAAPVCPPPPPPPCPPPAYGGCNGNAGYNNGYNNGGNCNNGGNGYYQQGGGYYNGY